MPSKLIMHFTKNHLKKMLVITPLETSARYLIKHEKTIYFIEFILILNREVVFLVGHIIDTLTFFYLVIKIMCSTLSIVSSAN